MSADQDRPPTSVGALGGDGGASTPPDGRATQPGAQGSQPAVTVPEVDVEPGHASRPLRLWWVLAGGIAVALTFAATDHMLRSTGTFVATLVGCAVLRLVVPDRVAGGLAVRRPWLDVLTLLALALALGVAGFSLDLTALR